MFAYDTMVTLPNTIPHVLFILFIVFFVFLFTLFPYSYSNFIHSISILFEYMYYLI